MYHIDNQSIIDKNKFLLKKLSKKCLPQSYSHIISRNHKIKSSRLHTNLEKSHNDQLAKTRKSQDQHCSPAAQLTAIPITELRSIMLHTNQQI